MVRKKPTAPNRRRTSRRRSRTSRLVLRSTELVLLPYLLSTLASASIGDSRRTKLARCHTAGRNDPRLIASHTDYCPVCRQIVLTWRTLPPNEKRLILDLVHPLGPLARL